MSRNAYRENELLYLIADNAKVASDTFILNSIERALNVNARMIYRAEAIRRGLIQPNSAAEYAATKLDQS